MTLMKTQIEQLLKPINPTRIGKDGKGFSHLEAWDVRAHLTRIFGFVNWSGQRNCLTCNLCSSRNPSGTARAAGLSATGQQ